MIEIPPYSRLDSRLITNSLAPAIEDQGVVDAMGGQGAEELKGLEFFSTFYTLNPRPSLRISIPQVVFLVVFLPNCGLLTLYPRY